MHLRYVAWFLPFALMMPFLAHSQEGAHSGSGPNARSNQEGKMFGEPVELKGRTIYFTSWKYVRQGNFTWRVEKGAGASPGEQQAGGWLRGDGGSPARFEPVDMPRGIRLVAQKAEKVPLRPGQRAAQVFDEGKYKEWDSGPPCPNSKARILPGHNAYLRYNESEDGITWRAPNLGLYEYAGSRNNSIVFRGDLNGSTRGWHGGSVFIDPSSKDERYKMIYLGIITDEEWDAFAKKYPGEADTMARRKDMGGFRCVVAVFGAVSPDGVHWKSLPEPLMIQHSDTMNTCYYDPDRKQYIAYIRMWQVGEKSAQVGDQYSDSWIRVGRRCIGRAVSPDFRHFSKPEIVISTGADMPPSHVWYTNAKTTLPDGPDNHVMFPWLWELERDGGDVYLFSSPDGRTWSQVPGGPVVERGPLGAADGGYVVCGINLLQYPGDKWGIPYSGSPIPHKYPGRDIEQRKGLFPGVKGVDGLAMWPKGRLVALQCDEEGEFATVAVIAPASRIRLNAVIPPTGGIKVAVSLLGKGDVPGRSFEDADHLMGDSLAMPVTWKGEADMKHNSAPVILRFQLREARLFGVEFY